MNFAFLTKLLYSKHIWKSFNYNQLLFNKLILLSFIVNHLFIKNKYYEFFGQIWGKQKPNCFFYIKLRILR